MDVLRRAVAAGREHPNDPLWTHLADHFAAMATAFEDAGESVDGAPPLPDDAPIVCAAKSMLERIKEEAAVRHCYVCEHSEWHDECAGV